MRRVGDRSIGISVSGAKDRRLSTPNAELPRDQVRHNQHLDDLRELELRNRKHRRAAKAGA